MGFTDLKIFLPFSVDKQQEEKGKIGFNPTLYFSH